MPPCFNHHHCTVNAEMIDNGAPSECMFDMTSTFAQTSALVIVLVMTVYAFWTVGLGVKDELEARRAEKAGAPRCVTHISSRQLCPCRRFYALATRACSYAARYVQPSRTFCSTRWTPTALDRSTAVKSSICASVWARR